MRTLIFVRIIIILMGLLSIQACSDLWDNETESALLQDGTKSADANGGGIYIPKTLAENKASMMIAGADINAAISNLEKNERYRKQRIVKVVDENMASYGLGKRVVIDWTGPVESLMKEVADYSGYNFKVVGIAPAIPIIVTVAHSDIEIGDIIRTAHLQAKERADVVIYPRSKTIEIRYFELG
jgi:ribosomal protein L21E